MVGITDEKLNEFALALGVDTNLSKLARKLGIRQSKIEIYIGTNRRNGSIEGTSAMLFDWKRKTPRARQIPILVKALNESGLVELVEEFFSEGERYPTDEGESGVHFELITDTPVDLNLQEDEAVISCGIRFSPSGVKLSKAFKVTLDHNAVFNDPQRSEIAFYTRGEGMENFERIPASIKGYPRCDVRNKDLDLYVDHFSDWWIVAMIKQYFIGKRVRCTPYVQQPKRPVYSVLLCINDDLQEVNKEVKEEMAEYTARYPPEPMVVAAGSGSVIIRLLEGRSEPFKEIKEERKKWNFYRIDRTRVHFLVDAPGAGSNHQCLTFLLDQTSSRFASDTDPARITFIQTFDATTPSTYTSAESSKTSGASVDFDDILEKIAKELFKKSDINTLGKALGFSPAGIGRYTDENDKQGGSHMGTLDMLRKWRQGQTTTTERTEMKSALLKGGFVKLADDLLGTPEPGAVGQTSHHSDETAVMAMSQSMGSSSSSVEVLATTSNSGREVTNEEITKLSKLLPGGNYSQFFEALGFDYDYAQNIKTQNLMVIAAASKELLQKWKAKTGGYMDVLDAAMIKAELGGLIPKYKK